MKPKEMFERLKERNVAGVLEFKDGPVDPAIVVEPEHLPGVLEALRDDPECRLDQLSLLSGVHYNDRFECVYHLLSIALKHDLVLKVMLDEKDPRVPTASFVHPTANWHERETYDLVGIRFDGHPNLRRIYLPEGWEGHPLQRDYVNPKEFNGIPLQDLKHPTESPQARAEALARAEEKEIAEAKARAEGEAGKEGDDKNKAK